MAEESKRFRRVMGEWVFFFFFLLQHLSLFLFYLVFLK